MDDDTDCDDFDADEFDRHILTKQGLLSVIEQLRGRVSHRWQFETLKSYMVGLVNCYGVYQSHPITAQAGLTLCRVRHLGSRETHIPHIEDPFRREFPGSFFCKKSHWRFPGGRALVAEAR